MKILKAGALVAFALSCASADAATPIHLWTFDDGTARDLVGGLNGTLNGSASIANGKLTVNGGFMSTSSENITLTAMTLVSWVSLSTLGQSGGSALSVVDSGQHFDAIDYGERTSGQWMNGSDSFVRSTPNNGGALANDLSEHMLAITYAANGAITIYRDGQFYASGGTFSPYTFTNEHYLVGLRHDTGGSAQLYGTINSASVYANDLSASDIASLYAQGSSATSTSAVPEPGTWAMMIAGFGAVGYALRRRRKIAGRAPNATNVRSRDGVPSGLTPTPLPIIA